jgi:hypothetical protein
VVAALLGAVAAAAIAPASMASAAALPNPTITFVTVDKLPGGGELRRATTTLIDVPTPLRIDAGSSPDVLATVVVLSLSRLTLVVDRLPGSTASLPASIEAVAHDPTGGDLGRQRIAVGYDARASGAPRHFKATALLGVGGDAQHFAVQQDTSGAADGLATTAELFDPGSAGTRLRSERVAVGFAPVASSVRIDATLGSPRIAVGVRTSQPTTATIDGALGDGDEVQSLHAVVDRLPSDVMVAYGEDAAGRPAVSYDAGDSIASLHARYEHHGGGGAAQIVTAAITGLPQHLSFVLTGDTAGVFTASAPIGQVDVAAASGEEPLAVAGTEPGVRIVAGEHGVSFAARLRGLQNARVDAGKALDVDATVLRQSLGVSVHTPALRVDGTIAGLPSQMTLHVDLAGGAVDYDGHGTKIDRIALVARGRFTAAIRRIAATIDALPAGHVRFETRRNQLTHVAFTAAEPLGTIDLAATRKGAPPPAARGHDLLYYHDARGAFAAHVRLTGLLGFTLALPARARDPIVATVKRVSRRPIDVDVRARLDKHAKDPLFVRGRFERLPSSMRLLVGGGHALHVAYDASARLGAIHLSAHGGGLPAQARHVRLDVSDLPRRLRVDQSSAGKVIEATASPSVGSLSVAVAARGEARPVAGSRSGLRLDGSSALAVRVRGLRALTVRTADPLRLDATLARQPFDVTVDQPRAGLRLTGTIADLPRRLGLTVDLPQGAVDYDGHGDKIGRIAVVATSRRPLLERARRVALTIASFPSAHVHFDARGGKVAFDASASLGTVDLTATDGSTTLPAHAADRDLVYYHDVPGAFALHARVTGVRHVAFASDPLTLALARAGRRPIDVDVRAGAGDPLVVAGHLEGLPRTMRFQLRNDAGTAHADYEASDRLTGLHLTGSGGALGLLHALVDLSGLPRHVAVDWPGDGTFAVRTDGPLGMLGFALADRAAARPIAGSGSGLRVVLDGPGKGIAGRLRGISGARLLQASPLKFEGTIARQPLAVTVDSPKDGLHVAGTLADLPHDVTITFAPDAGIVDYDGHGDQIGRIAFDVRTRKALIPGAGHIFGTILGLPSGQLRLRAGAGGLPAFAFTASAPIGLIDVTATGGPRAPRLADGRDLVYIHSRRGHHVYRVRVSGLRHVSLTPSARSGGSLTARIARSSPVPLDVSAAVALPGGALAVRGSLTGLPSDVTLALRTAGGVHAAYSAAGPLRAIHLVATGSALPKPIARVAFDARDVADRLNVSLAPGSDALVFDASRPIGQLDVAATDGCAGRPRAFDDATDRVYYRDLPSRFAVYARVSQLRRVTYAASPTEVAVARPGGGPLHFDVLTQRGKVTQSARGRCAKGAARRAGAKRATSAARSGSAPAAGAARSGSKRAASSAPSGARPLRLAGSLEGVPDGLQLKLLDGGDVHAIYTASGTLGRLSLLVRGLGDGSTSILTRADRVPRRLTVDYQSDRCNQPHQHCGAIVRASRGPSVKSLVFKLAHERFITLDGKADKLVIASQPSGLGIAARVRNLRYVRAQVERPPYGITVATDGAPQPPLVIDARLATPSALWTGAIAATLRDLPQMLRICVDRGPGCAESGQPHVANSLRIVGDEALHARPLRMRAVVCFKRTRNANCTGTGSARLVAILALQRLAIEFTPGLGGYVFANTLPPSGDPKDGLPINGDLGYFSSDRQRVCLRLVDGRFARTLYPRQPRGGYRFGTGGGAAFTFLGEPPRITCDDERTGKGYKPRSLPGAVLPTERFSSPGAGG